MKIRVFALCTAAAFAFGIGFSASAFSAGTLQPAAAGCITCHNNCDRSLDACLAAGTAPDICYARSTRCHRGCGCPIP